MFDKAGFEFEYHYRPTRERLRQIYQSCDIFLCPSWYEGLGLPSMEAMACRCALVASDTGGCLDYAINGKTALVSPPRDIDRLSENIIRLMDDKKLLESISFFILSNSPNESMISFYSIGRIEFKIFNIVYVKLIRDVLGE